MRYFFDTEFNEDGKTIDLISIGMVCEDGRELYRCNSEARLDLVNDWVRENVLPSLPNYSDPAWVTRDKLKFDVLWFVNSSVPQLLGKFDKPEIWAYYADYDWVAFCQLFGRMIDLPTNWPKYCMDLKQLSKSKGSPQHPPQTGTEHHALEDARWNLKLYNFLQTFPLNEGSNVDDR